MPRSYLFSAEAQFVSAPYTLSSQSTRDHPNRSNIVFLVCDRAIVLVMGYGGHLEEVTVDSRCHRPSQNQYLPQNRLAVSRSPASRIVSTKFSRVIGWKAIQRHWR